MDHKGTFFTKDGRKIYVVREICDYFSKSVFERLLEEEKYAKSQGAEFYVGLYSDAVLEKHGKPRQFKGIVEDSDRVNAVESLDFVDGAFVIKSPDIEEIESNLDSRLAEQEKERRERAAQPAPEKKYSIGYASGAFSNLHKGHVEHIREMAKQCETVIVAANSDRLIREYKHKEAAVDEETRRAILSHIRYVDVAMITDDYDKLAAVERVRQAFGAQFDAIFVGSDWKGNPNWEDFGRRLGALGIDIVFTDRPENGISTSKIDAARKKGQAKKKEETETTEEVKKKDAPIAPTDSESGSRNGSDLDDQDDAR